MSPSDWNAYNIGSSIALLLIILALILCGIVIFTAVKRVADDAKDRKNGHRDSDR